MMMVENSSLTAACKAYSDSLFSPSFIISILKEKRLSLKKTFGQNFLINRDIASQILHYSDLQSTDTVLEIGPGLGTLTFIIAEKVDQVIAVEIDGGIARCLQDKVKEFEIKNIHIINDDFINLQYSDLQGQGYPNKAVCNFPYKIGIKALFKIIDEFPGIQQITGTVQKELAERITSLPGAKEYSYVSVYLQYAAEIKVIEKKIAPANFFPEPGVDSSIIAIKVRPERKREERKIFKNLVKVCFSSRRKSLVNNLQRLDSAITKNRLKEMVSELFHDDHIRAEQLSIRDFEMLTEQLFRHGWN